MTTTHPTRACQAFISAALLSLLSACGGGDDPSMTTSSSSGTTGGTSSGTSGGSSGSSTAATTDVLTYHYDSMRTGQNLTETVLTPANVATATFGLLRTVPADAPVDAAPLIATNVSIGGSSHTVVYVASENATIYAYDVDSGALLAQASMLGSGETASDMVHNCDQVSPKIGITATPVIDRKQGPNGTLYVVAMSLDSGSTHHQRLHALDLTTLADRVPAMEIVATAQGTGSGSSNGILTFDPSQYKERGALLAANSQIYTVWASHCDVGAYNGWVIAYNEATLAQTASLNYTPNGTMGATWDVAGLAADSSGALYGMSGNGTFDTVLTNAGFPVGGDFGNGVMKLASTATSLSVSDFYEATNTVSESNGDVDLGSGSPLLLPDQTDAMGAIRHLLVGAGKDGNVLLLDRDNLGKYNGSTDTALQRLVGGLSGGLFAAFAYYNSTVYVADVGGSLKAFAIDHAQLSSSPVSQTQATFPFPGASPSVSANGKTNAILWALNSSTGSAAVLRAYNPADLSQEYYDSTQAASDRDAFGNGEKFITPVVANGKVFVGTPSGVAIFGLLSP